MNLKKTISSLAFAALAMQVTVAHATFALDFKIGEAMLGNSGDATELAALKAITGDDSLVQDFNLNVSSGDAAPNPGTLDQWVLDIAPDTPGYFILKFGTGGTSASADTFFFQNIGELTKLVWSNADVQFLSGGNCRNGNDDPCNITRLSHYRGFDGNGGTVPEPATVGLLGLGLLGFALSRRHRSRHSIR